MKELDQDRGDKPKHGERERHFIGKGQGDQDRGSGGHRDDRHQGDNASWGDDKGRNDEGDEADEGREAEKSAERGGYATAPAETSKHRPDVSNDSGGCAGGRRPIIVKDEPSNERRTNALRDVRYDYEGGRELSSRPQDVGHPRLAAASIPNVFMKPEVADHQSCWD